MKSIITLLISLAWTLNSFGQCEENAVLVTSKTNLTDVSGNPVGIKNERTVLMISKSAIHLNIDGQDHGDLKIVSQSCKWTTPYKEGKSVIEATMNDFDYTITIQGKEGHIGLKVVKHLSDDNILSMTADKYEKAD